MTPRNLIEPKLKIGDYMSELTTSRQYIRHFRLDDESEFERIPFFLPNPPQPGIGPHGRHMVEPSFRRYRCQSMVAYEFGNVHLLGTDGIVLLDDVAVRDTLNGIATWQADSNVAEVRREEYVQLRHAMPVTFSHDDGPCAIGFNGAWRNHGHWLLQCLPKLYAYVQLRKHINDLKVALPPAPSVSAIPRTMELLGIEPAAVVTVPPNEVTRFASAVLLPAFDIWSIGSFAIRAAAALAARLLPSLSQANHPDRIYIHRTVVGRNVENFELLRPLLNRYGFTAVSFEHMDFAKQIATMLAARYVISEHGASTTNILFCRADTRVLQLFNPYCVEPTFWSIASCRGIAYGYLIGNHSTARSHVEPSWNSDYVVPLDLLESAIQATLVAPPVLAPRSLSSFEASLAPLPSGPKLVARTSSSVAPPEESATSPPVPVSPAVVHSAARRPRPFAPTSGFGGIAQPIFELVNDASRFARTDSDQRMQLFSPAVPPPQLPIHNEVMTPRDFVEEHYIYRTPSPVHVYAVGGAILWSSGFVTLGSRYIAIPDCLPGYFRDTFREGGPPLPPIFAGAIGRADVRTIALDRPVAVATHPNLGYGRFLLESLPRLWLLAVLREYGADIPVALSHTLSDSVKLFARLLHAEHDTVWYDGAKERVQAPSIVLPTMLHTEYNFHPALNLMVRDLVRGLRASDPNTPKLVYLAQANFGDEKLENQSEAEEAMRGLGFAVIRLGELNPQQQIRLFAAARVVVGEYGEALHGALFAPPGTCIIAINFANHYQSAIARLRGHRVGYVPPADGQFRHWRLTPGLSPRWRVNITVLTRTVWEMMQGVD